MFQYAFGRALSIRHNAGLELDVYSGFMRDAKYQRSYELDVFSIADDIHLSRPSRLMATVAHYQYAFARRCGFFMDHYLIEDDSTHYSAESLQANVRSHCSVHGYWQSVRYFQGIEQELREDLKFSRDLQPRNQKIANEMQNSESVAIHVRREQYDGAIGVDYYDAAISAICRELPNAKLYCFTDAPVWCEQMLLPKYEMTLINNTGLPAIEDFQLMSQCRHYIIANSSFSWWAAWLGGAEGVVLTPSTDSRNSATDPLDRPEHWRTVQANS